jgi:Uma2 family endonuclease
MATQRIARGLRPEPDRCLGVRPKAWCYVVVVASVRQLADLVAPERVRPLRRDEFERMVEEGHFRDERLELLQGVLVAMSPQGTRHAATVQRLNAALLPPLLGRAQVRIQMPLAVSEDSEPEPDVAVVPDGDYDRAHPTTAFLVVEVSETSLNKDRLVKAALYAAASVEEYWIVDLSAGLVEVHTDPISGRYTRLTPARAGDVLRPRAFADLEIPVADFLR